MLTPVFSCVFSGDSSRSGEGPVENRIFLASVFLLVRANRQAEWYLEKKACEIARLRCPAIRFSTGFPHVFPHGFPHKKMKSRTVPDFIFLLPVVSPRPAGRRGRRPLRRGDERRPMAAPTAEPPPNSVILSEAKNPRPPSSVASSLLPVASSEASASGGRPMAAPTA